MERKNKSIIFFSKSKNNQQTEPAYSVYVVTSEIKTQPIMVGG